MYVSNWTHFEIYIYIYIYMTNSVALQVKLGYLA